MEDETARSSLNDPEMQTTDNEAVEVSDIFALWKGTPEKREGKIKELPGQIQKVRRWIIDNGTKPPEGHVQMHGINQNDESATWNAEACDYEGDVELYEQMRHKVLELQLTGDFSIIRAEVYFEPEDPETTDDLDESIPSSYRASFHVHDIGESDTDGIDEMITHEPQRLTELTYDKLSVLSYMVRQFGDTTINSVANPINSSPTNLQPNP